MSIKLHLNSLFQNRNLEEIKNLLDAGKPTVTFWGHRSVKLNTNGINETIKISRLLSLVEELKPKQNPDDQQADEEDKLSIKITLYLMDKYEGTKEIVQQANIIHRIFIFICDFFGISNSPSFGNHSRDNLEAQLIVYEDIENIDKKIKALESD